MSFFSRKKRNSEVPSTSQSPFRLSQEQSQPVYPWSAHPPPFGQSPSPFLRHAHALSTSATVGGELFLFGGYVHGSRSPSNDLYIFSTQDFTTTLLETSGLSGDVPSPRFAHRAVLTSTTFLIWGGCTDFSDQDAQHQSDDDSFYLLNLLSRKWTRIMVSGPGPGGRYYHTMTLVGSKLFVFGGRSAKRSLNDIWALDLNTLKTNPFWESYEPAPGNAKPSPRVGHVAVTTGDRIIIFGGYGGRHDFNDTWSFNILTREWTELKCTGSIPPPRAKHAAVLIDDAMYVFGGSTHDRACLGDLIALNLSTNRWAAFQDIGPSPCKRRAHAMASDGRRVFLLGGGAQSDDAKPIHVLDTKHLHFPEPATDSVSLNEMATQLVRSSSAGPSTLGQPHQPSSSSDAHATHDASSFREATPEEPDHPAFQQVSRERTTNLNGLPPQSTEVDDKRRCVPQEGDDSESSTEYSLKLVEPDTSSEKEVAQREHQRTADLERQLSEMLAMQTQRDQHITQLSEQLVQKSTLLEQAEANAIESKKCAELEQSNRRQLDELLLSRDRALEQAQSALREATFCAAEANERNERVLAEAHVKLEASESELAAVRLRLTEAEDGWAKSKAEADTLRAGTQAAVGLVNMDVDRVMRRLMERVRSVEAEIVSLRGNEKSRKEIEWCNEGRGDSEVIGL